MHGPGMVAGRSARRPVVLDRTARERPAGRAVDSASTSRDLNPARLRQGPEIRQDLVSRIRREIQNGQYDTTERIEAAMEALGDEVDLLD